MAKAILSPAVEVEYSFTLKYKDYCKWRCNQQVVSPAIDDNGFHRFEGVGFVSGISMYNDCGVNNITVYVMTHPKIERVKDDEPHLRYARRQLGIDPL